GAGGCGGAPYCGGAGGCGGAPYCGGAGGPPGGGGNGLGGCPGAGRAPGPPGWPKGCGSADPMSVFCGCCGAGLSCLPPYTQNGVPWGLGFQHEGQGMVGDAMIVTPRFP